MYFWREKATIVEPCAVSDQSVKTVMIPLFAYFSFLAGVGVLTNFRCDDRFYIYLGQWGKERMGYTVTSVESKDARRWRSPYHVWSIRLRNFRQFRVYNGKSHVLKYNWGQKQGCKRKHRRQPRTIPRDPVSNWRLRWRRHRHVCSTHVQSQHPLQNVTTWQK